MMEEWIDGVVADLGHLEKPPNVKGFAIDPSKLTIDQLEECLTEVDLLLVLAGVPCKADMTRDNLININADIETGIAESAATYCANATLGLMLSLQWQRWTKSRAWSL
jgi:malate/lactate dehydrogenase